MEIIQRYKTTDGLEWDKKEVAEYRQQILEAQKVYYHYFQEYQKIRDLCQHEKITYKHKSNTGNYCPSDDSYWAECCCLVCDKKWDESQQDAYQKYGKTGKGIQIK